MTSVATLALSRAERSAVAARMNVHVASSGLKSIAGTSNSGSNNVTLRQGPPDQALEEHIKFKPVELLPKSCIDPSCGMRDPNVPRIWLLLHAASKTNMKAEVAVHRNCQVKKECCGWTQGGSSWLQL